MRVWAMFHEPFDYAQSEHGLFLCPLLTALGSRPDGRPLGRAEIFVS